MPDQTPADGKRALDSWISQFVTFTSNTESPELLRKWTAIATIAAVLEQKVWIKTSSNLYPNLYTFLVAPPGVGKSRALNAARDLIMGLPEKERPFIAPTSINAATLVDQMKDSKREVAYAENGVMKSITYNALCILVGEFGTFMSKYEDDIVANLTDFYDVTPYGQRRRGQGGLKIDIERPLLNMIVGSTPATLMKFMPELAWEQGFTSRIIFVPSNERSIVDDFATRDELDNSALIADLATINRLHGRFHVTDEYAKLITLWREQGEPPKPSHPRLSHYNSRRKTHIYRLSMIAAIDRGNTLVLDRECFNIAMNWLVEVEQAMPSIFGAASDSSDERAIQEIFHFVQEYWNKTGKAISEHKLIGFARQRVPAHAVLKVLDLMIQSGQLAIVATDDRSKLRHFAAIDPNLSADPGQALLQ